jgi:hypothetical protein
MYTNVSKCIQISAAWFSSRARAYGGGGTISAHPRQAWCNARLLCYSAAALAAALAAATTLNVDHFYKFHSPKKCAMASFLAPQRYACAQLKGKSLIYMCHISFGTFVTNPQARWSLANAENLLKYLNNAQKSGDSRRLLTAPVWLQTAEMAPAAFTSTFPFIIPSPMDSFTALGGL